MYRYAPTLQFVTPHWLVITMQRHASADAPKKANTKGRARRNGTLLAQREHPVGVVRYCAPRLASLHKALTLNRRLP